jgi:signal transduction histidine kinase
MIERKNTAIMAGFVLAVSLLSTALTAFFLSKYDSHKHTQVLGQICQGIVDNLDHAPEAEQAVLTALNEYTYRPAGAEQENILQDYGYHRTDFLRHGSGNVGLFILAGFLAGGLLFLGTFLFWNSRERSRIKALTDYLEKVNAGGNGVLFRTGEDEFSKLQDEIYKTVTELYQTRDAAVEARNRFAENLYNIAHQIKTPVTSISLSVQMMGRDFFMNTKALKYAEQIMRQTAHLTYLEEALLLLSRIDAGTLTLQKRETDVFTLLVLSADNLQELFQKSGITVDIPEAGEMTICVDMDWTMEAVMNLLKNCMEHTPFGGVVHCSCEQNPLYTQIRIWDTGTGFAVEDIPHLFERFYRGKDAVSGGIGIGLALSKTIIERQNGTVTARNLPEGGACFEIRFYCH